MHTALTVTAPTALPAPTADVDDRYQAKLRWDVRALWSPQRRLWRRRGSPRPGYGGGREGGGRREGTLLDR